MRRETAIENLRSRQAALEARGAVALFLFGSTARGDEGPHSDLDLFIDYDFERGFSLFQLVAMKTELEHELRTSVDITARDSLHPLLRDRIEREAIRIF